MISKTKYANGTSITRSYPWGEHVKARAVCPDGKIRNTVRIAKTADTFFSVPAAMRIDGKYTRGYITVETVRGFSTETPEDPAIVRFKPYAVPGVEFKPYTGE